MSQDPLTVVCVLRSGGDYGPEYVENLAQQVDENLARAYTFVCYSDMVFDIPGVVRIPLEHAWPGWWSKMEAFRAVGPSLYLDLDTAVLGSLDYTASRIFKASAEGETAFWMLRPFRRGERWASGVMAWTGDWSSLYLDFDYQQASTLLWDQRWISKQVEAGGQEIWPVQELMLNPVYSYKHHCRKDGPPSDASIVCFHGLPRPHTIGEPYFA